MNNYDSVNINKSPKGNGIKGPATDKGFSRPPKKQAPPPPTPKNNPTTLKK